MNKYTKYSLLKSAIEQIFGSKAWYDLKESNSISTWKKYLIRTLQAIRLSIEDTVEIYDEDWHIEINEHIERGIKSIKSSNSIDDAISSLAGCLIHISFMQIGFMPMRKGNSSKVALRKGQWELNSYRSVVYLQTKEQKESLFWSKQQRKMGWEPQMELHRKYKQSKSKLPYSEWCKNNVES